MEKSSTKYDYISSETLEQYKTEELEKAFLKHKLMFKLTKNQYKQYLAFRKKHKECLYDPVTLRHRFGTIGGGISIIYKTNKNNSEIDKYVKCHWCNAEEKLEDKDIDFEISEEELNKEYERQCQYGVDLSHVEFYRLNEIWKDHKELTISFMGTGLGYLINVKTNKESFDITDTSCW